MVSFEYDFPRQIFNNPWSKAFLYWSTLYFPRKNLELMTVAILRWSSFPHFDAKFRRFSREVLLKWQPAFVRYHSLIDTLLSERIVIWQAFIQYTIQNCMWQSLSWPGVLRGGFCESSLQCKYLEICSKRDLGIISGIEEFTKGHILVQASEYDGIWTTEMYIHIPK